MQLIYVLNCLQTLLFTFLVRQGFLFTSEASCRVYCFDKLVILTFHLRTKVCKFTCACLVQMFCTASSQLVTVRNYCCGKVMFLQVSVHGGCLPLG